MVVPARLEALPVPLACGAAAMGLALPDQWAQASPERLGTISVLELDGSIRPDSPSLTVNIPSQESDRLVSYSKETSAGVGFEFGWAARARRPASMYAGFRHKAGFIVPLTLREDENSESRGRQIHVPSVLVVLDGVIPNAGGDDETDGGEQKRKKHGDLKVQFFSTGHSATRTAQRAEVRKAVLSDLLSK